MNGALEYIKEVYETIFDAIPFEASFLDQTTFSWWIIPLGGLIILYSSILTAAMIIIRAASRNPVETMRYE